MNGEIRKQTEKSERLAAKGDFAGARAILLQLLARHPTHADTAGNLAIVASQAGNLPEALDYALRAVKLEPASGPRLGTVGQILFQLSRFDQAASAFGLAAQLAPRNAKLHSAHAVALRQLERFDESIAASLRAIELDANVEDAFDNLAITLVTLRDYDRAVDLFYEAVRRTPRSASAWNNLGCSLNAIGGRTEEAAKALRQAVALDPKEPAARMNLGMALLKQGDFANGWREYESRWDVGVQKTVRRPASLPRWDGSPAPRTILLHAEQGLGDTLQFCRYAPIVAACGHHVVLEVQPEVVQLLTDSLASESVSVIARAKTYPKLDGLPPVDAHCSLMSLPLVLGTSLETVPGETYLRADPQRCAVWRERFAALGEGLRVGLVWAGSPRREASIAVRETDARRSTTLSTFAPLLAVPGARFVSLQKGEGLDELRQPRYAQIYDADPQLGSFADTAAAVANLDLVICVDTSMSHLVGGMGKPVWMLSRYDGCFRWLEDRTDTPWYPNMRIFNQGPDRDWNTVLPTVATALAEAVGRTARQAAE